MKTSIMLTHGLDSVGFAILVVVISMGLAFVALAR